MRFLIQVVDGASVEVTSTDEMNTSGKDYKAGIGTGLLIYLGVSKADIEDYTAKIDQFVTRIHSLQIFHKDGKLLGTVDELMQEGGGEILLVSNFTLYGENKKGNRFDFGESAGFLDAKKIYESLIEKMLFSGLKVKTGIFGAYMKVSSVCDGPINVILDL